MPNRWNSASLHDELYLYYSQFKHVPAPRNSFTENLWQRIEQAEFEEATRRGDSKKA